VPGGETGVGRPCKAGADAILHREILNRRRIIAAFVAIYIVGILGGFINKTV
jgi:hypothetical protein